MEEKILSPFKQWENEFHKKSSPLLLDNLSARVRNRKEAIQLIAKISQKLGITAPGLYRGAICHKLEAYYTPLNHMIWISRKGRVSGVYLHELTHAYMQQKKISGSKEHSPEFARCFVRVVACYLDKEQLAELTASMIDGGALSSAELGP